MFQVRGLSFFHYLSHQLHTDAFNYVPLETVSIWGNLKISGFFLNWKCIWNGISGPKGTVWLRARVWGHSPWAWILSSCVTLSKFFHLSLSVLTRRDGDYKARSERLHILILLIGHYEKRQNYRERKQVDGCLGWKAGVGTDCKQARELFRVRDVP